MTKLPLVAAFLAVVSMASAQSIPKPDVTYIANTMDCRADGIGYCYAHALLNEGTHYKAYFFSPANTAYVSGAGECIYVAKSTALASTNWQVYSRDSTTGESFWQSPPYSLGAWMPVACNVERRSQVITSAGSGFVAGGWNSMQDQMSIDYTNGPPTQIQYQLVVGSAVGYPAHYGTVTGVWAPSGFTVKRVTFDYETNYDNAKVFAGVTIPGNATVWAKDVYGNNFGSASVSVPPGTPWVGFGLFSKTAFTVPSPNWVFRVKNATIWYEKDPTENGTLVGDPAVFKQGGTYYMLSSVQLPNSPGAVYGATSLDGVNWTGQTFLFIGHRPSIVNDGTTVRAWYDAPFQSYLRMEMRSIPVSQLANFLTPSAWSAPQVGSQMLQSGNTELTPMGTGYFVVTDSIDAAGYHDVDYSYTPDGLNFDSPQALFGREMIPVSVGADHGPSVPQLFKDGLDTYVLASTMIWVADHWNPNRSLLFRLDPYYFAPTNAGPGYYAAGWSNMQAQMEAPAYSSSNGETWITYRMAQGASVPALGSAGTSFGPPVGKKIYKVSFDYVTNYNNALVYAGLTVPGNANFWKYDVYGNQTGSVSLELPNVDWFGLGMFSKTSFVAPANWLFQVHNLRIYYH